MSKGLLGLSFKDKEVGKCPSCKKMLKGTDLELVSTGLLYHEMVVCKKCGTIINMVVRK
ncbi:MAG: hypothetical protein HYW25_00975 [Candidatus Aenigmarchaeota archaeon]|nr:hypothetical protein [Candidatus Aenigmarchaeota archaeon]